MNNNMKKELEKTKCSYCGNKLCLTKHEDALVCRNRDCPEYSALKYEEAVQKAKQLGQDTEEPDFGPIYSSDWKGLGIGQGFCHPDTPQFPPTKANNKQYGGTHYKEMSIQPWDYIISNNLGFLEGNAIKYISRWKEKNGIEDLRKAIHYIEKLIEIHTTHPNYSSAKADSRQYQKTLPSGKD